MCKAFLRPTDLLYKREDLGQKYKFSDKNDLLCAQRDFKNNHRGIYNYAKRKFKPKISSIFYFKYVNKV